MMLKLLTALLLLAFLSVGQVLLAQEEAAAESPVPAEPAPEEVAAGEETEAEPHPDADLIPEGEPTSAEQLLALWLQSYGGLQSLEVAFTQERKLKTLKLPVRSTGNLWMDNASGKFRWQIGEPPKTVVVSDGARIKIAHPKRNKVEYREAGSGDSGAPGFSMIAGGFPRTVEGFLNENRILKAVKAQNYFELHTKPIRGESAQAVEEMVYLIDLDEYFLRGFDISLRDGSEVRSEFHDVRRNPSIDPQRFEFDTTGYSEK